MGAEFCWRTTKYIWMEHETNEDIVKKLKTEPIIDEMFHWMQCKMTDFPNFYQITNHI
jgi:hypothetical protein